ncbi:MAG TPA: pyridoxamine 5'-phosphate oxidase family protein [Thermomicrobiales bacterium]|nr:pyridoxamine 5'-phosphate oxidase family protein [Thermomicrobiales bacterium]
MHPDAIEAVLRRHHVGRLACVVDDQPYVVPITYTYADGVIYGHSGPGAKLTALRADPRVAFEVDERWETDSWRSVVARCSFEELTDAAGQEAALKALRGAYPDASRTIGDGVLFQLRLIEKSGRQVLRSPLVQQLDALTTPLQDVDLRAGDELNFPSGAAAERDGRD